MAQNRALTVRWMVEVQRVRRSDRMSNRRLLICGDIIFYEGGEKAVRKMVHSRGKREEIPLADLDTPNERRDGEFPR